MGVGTGMTINIGNQASSTQAVESSAQLAGALRVRSSHSDAAPEAVEVTDQAQLSSAASLASRASVLPDVRMDKVAAMQSAIASGYHVSSSDVAGAMIDHMLSRSE